MVKVKPTAATTWATFARVLLYTPSHKQDSTCHGHCYTSCVALVGCFDRIQLCCVNTSYECPANKCLNCAFRTLDSINLDTTSLSVIQYIETSYIYISMFVLGFLGCFFYYCFGF